MLAHIRAVLIGLLTAMLFAVGPVHAAEGQQSFVAALRSQAFQTGPSPFMRCSARTRPMWPRSNCS